MWKKCRKCVKLSATSLHLFYMPTKRGVDFVLTLCGPQKKKKKQVLSWICRKNVDVFTFFVKSYTL